MKTFKKLSYLIFAGMLIAACGKNERKTETGTEQKTEAGADTVTYKIDTAASAVKWTGKKIAGQHNGKIKIQGGDISAIGNNVVSGNILVNMASISNEDLTDKTYNDKLVGHLHSDDFFSTAKFPTASLVITNIKDGANGKKLVTGNLTIKGTTHEVTFPADLNADGTTLKGTGKAIVDRSKYNVQYGSKTFFPNIGDKMINDEFELEFDIVAKK